MENLQPNQGRQSSSCCLCRRLLLESSTLKKRKLFHGERCIMSKNFLDEVSLEQFQLPVSCFKETQDPEAYLCHLCDNYGITYRKRQNQLKQIKEDVISKLLKLTKLPSTGTKRST